MSKKNGLRAVYILSISNAVFTLGYGMYAYIFPTFLTSINATPPEVGLVSTIIVATMAITYFPGGILSDAGHRRKLVIASWLLPVFAPPFFILAQLINSWLGAIPGAIIFASSWIGVPAVQSYTSEAAPRGKRGLSFGILLSSGSFGLVPSPVIGGIVVVTYGFIALFLIAFILYLVSTVMVLAIPKFPGDTLLVSDTANRGSFGSKTSNIGSTSRTECRRNVIDEQKRSDQSSDVLRRLAPMLAVSCLFMGLEYLGLSYIPLYLTYQYHFNYVLVQLLYTILNLSSIVVVNALGKLSDRYSPANKLLLVSVPAASLGVGYWILIHTSNMIALSVCFVLLGSLGSVFPLIYSTVGELCAENRVGRTYGVIGTFIYAAESATPYLGGTLYAISGQLPFMLTLELIPLIFVATYIAHVKTR
jgi:MFS family permease